MWKEVVSSLILGIVGVFISALSLVVTNWINSRIKAEKTKRIVNDINTICLNAVEYVYQVYVENIKGTSLWNEEAMKKASDEALTYIKTNLPKEAMKFLENNYDDVSAWLLQQIEVFVQKFKKGQ